jgi:hypothetical protein
MMQKLDGLTAARIRLFQATGMASPRMLPFDRPGDRGGRASDERRLVNTVGQAESTRPSVTARRA